MSGTFVPPEWGPHAIRPRRVRKGHADDHWLSDFRYEGPRDDPAFPEVFTYTDAISYDPGDTVSFHGSTTAARWSIHVYRDGHRPQMLHVSEDLPGQHAPTPPAAYRDGCGWPVVHRLTLPPETPSGLYRVVSTCDRPDGERFVQHHAFIVRPTPTTRRSAILQMCATGTWTAYNDWGGANHYFGVAGDNGQSPSPVLSLERPWTRGMIWLPAGAPRIVIEPAPRFGDAPRFPMKDWGYANGFGQYYAAAGWAQYDRHFHVWAEADGLNPDLISQHDLHFRPEILADYACLVVVGHDEYWSWDMRKAVEAWVERGGRLVRLGGNFMWQIRLEDGGRTQHCYKFSASETDPVRHDPERRHLLTGAWDDRHVRWPGASTVGVNAFNGIYASWGGFGPKGQRGFTVYRPDHWVFDGTNLRYADIFGDEAQIFGYEVDGLDYTFRDGLPYPLPVEGVPETVSILAMAPAMFAEHEHEGEGFRYYVSDSDFEGAMSIAQGCVEQARRRYRYGSGMLVHMPKGSGDVITGGSCEWIMGLTRGDPYTITITRNACLGPVAKSVSDGGRPKAPTP